MKETAMTPAAVKDPAMDDNTATPAISLRQALAFWFKLGFISFGGPAGQIALMHRVLVDERRWISDRRFLHSLNYCMLLPGPEAQQLATYIGWLMHRTWGGVAAGVLFVLPSLFILIALSWVYVVFGQVPWVAALLYGIKPAVAAIVAHAVWRIGSKILKNPARVPVVCALAATSFIAIAVFNVPFPAVVGVAALVGVAGARWAPGQFSGAGHSANTPANAATPATIDDNTPSPPHARFSRSRLATVLAVGAALWLLPMAALLLSFGWQGTVTQMAWFFTKAALLTFGGAYAVLPYVYQGAVEHFQWLTAAQMLDGLALGETTPGPLIMVVAFVGFLGGWVRQVLGPEMLFMGAALAAVVVTWFTFLPSFIFILAGGPLVESTHGKLGFTAPLTAISAAVVGVMAHLAAFFIAAVAMRAGATGPFYAQVDWAAVAIMLVAAGVLFTQKAGVIPVIAGCAVAGLVVKSLLGG